MKRGKWEDLNRDCLVNVLSRVGLESLLLDVPFVCKSWYKATLSPLCWRRLAFPKMSADIWSYEHFLTRFLDEYQLKQSFSVTEFIKSIVKRSERSATFVALPICCTEEALAFVADECPNLRALLLAYDLREPLDNMIPNLISKWKNLEILVLGNHFKMQEVLAQLSIHCKNLFAFGVISARIEKDDGSAIVTLLPNIKYLSLKHAHLKKENLTMILKGCKQLVYFDVRDCEGFDEGDEEILKLASHIGTFKPEGSFSDDYICRDQCCSFRDDEFLEGYWSDY